MAIHGYSTRLQSRRRRAAATLRRFGISVGRKRRIEQTIDPITLCEVERPIFVHVDGKSGQETVFGATMLAQYVIDSGDFRHPLTRCAFLRPELLRLQRVSALPVLDEMERSERRRKERQEQESLLQWLEGEAMEQAQAVARSVQIGSVFQLSTTALPMLVSALERVRAVDSSRATEICDRGLQMIEEIEDCPLRLSAIRHLRAMKGRIEIGMPLEAPEVAPRAVSQSIFALLLENQRNR